LIEPRGVDMNRISLMEAFPQIEVENANLKLRSLTLRRWLRTDEVALYLGISKMAVKHMVMRGRLNPKKFSGRLYYDRSELDRRIENSDSKK